jgi:hypothetical protein
MLDESDERPWMKLPTPKARQLGAFLWLREKQREKLDGQIEGIKRQLALETSRGSRRRRNRSKPAPDHADEITTSARPRQGRRGKMA